MLLDGRVLAEVGEGELILKPREKATDLLEKPRFNVSPVQEKQLSKLRRKLASDLEGR